MVSWSCNHSHHLSHRSQLYQSLCSFERGVQTKQGGGVSEYWQNSKKTFSSFHIFEKHVGQKLCNKSGGSYFPENILQNPVRLHLCQNLPLLRKNYFLIHFRYAIFFWYISDIPSFLIHFRYTIIFWYISDITFFLIHLMNPIGRYRNMIEMQDTKATFTASFKLTELFQSIAWRIFIFWSRRSSLSNINRCAI